MITQLSGKLVEAHPSHIVVDCGGVGYWVNISLQTFSNIEKKESLTIYTYLVVREDNQTLYGFYSKAEREVFQRLISVNGVGPSTAMMMLSSLEIDEITTAIENADAKTLQGVKGIGIKTAQRIIIDLKDKLSEELLNFDTKKADPKNKSKNETLSALEVLGIPKKNAEKILEIVIKQFPDSEAEVLVKEVLKRL